MPTKIDLIQLENNQQIKSNKKNRINLKRFSFFLIVIIIISLILNLQYYRLLKDEESYNTALGKERYHIGFSTDKVLTENEYKFIVSISDDLKTLVEPIYDIKKSDVRKNSKMKDFIKSLDILNNWSPNSENTLSGTSPFDYLQIN